jgi:hypothetical protein
MQSEHLRAFLKAAPDLIAGDMDLRQFAMISKKILTPRLMRVPARFLERKISCSSQARISSLLAPQATLAPPSPSA